jgi:hypothetical protein
MEVFQREEHVLVWLKQAGVSISDNSPNKVPLSPLRSARRNLRDLHSAA